MRSVGHRRRIMSELTCVSAGVLCVRARVCVRVFVGECGRANAALLAMAAQTTWGSMGSSTRWRGGKVRHTKRPTAPSAGVAFRRRPARRRLLFSCAAAKAALGGRCTITIRCAELTGQPLSNADIPPRSKEGEPGLTPLQLFGHNAIETDLTRLGQYCRQLIIPTGCPAAGVWPPLECPDARSVLWAHVAVGRRAPTGVYPPRRRR